MNWQEIATFGTFIIVTVSAILGGVWAIENRFEKKLERVKTDIKGDIQRLSEKVEGLSEKVESNGKAIARLEVHYKVQGNTHS